MLQTHEPDECCGKTLSKAIFSGNLDDRTTWTHSKCGQEWRAVMIGEVKHWAPHCVIQVWP